MITLTNRFNSRFDNQVQDWERRAFVPLDETEAYERLDAFFVREAARRALTKTSGIDDVDLLDALIDAGFDEETLPALQLVPIAFAAWASDSVTDQESRAAVWSIYEFRLFEFPEAASRVQRWLDVRPGQELWDLWLAFTQCRLENTPDTIRQISGNQLLEQATAVAIASGGMVGIGTICAAEQDVLDGIRNAYRV